MNSNLLESMKAAYDTPPSSLLIPVPSQLPAGQPALFPSVPAPQPPAAAHAGYCEEEKQPGFFSCFMGRSYSLVQAHFKGACYPLIPSKLP